MKISHNRRRGYSESVRGWNQEAQGEETLDITPPIAYKRRSSPRVQPQERQQAKPCPSRTPPPPPPQAAAAPTPAKPAASRRNRAPSRRLLDSISRSDCFPNLDPDLLLQKLRYGRERAGVDVRFGDKVWLRFIGPGPLQLVSERVKPTRCCPGWVGKGRVEVGKPGFQKNFFRTMPPKNARVARPAAANLRATRRVTRSASQASSEAESRRGGAPENENPVEMPNVANAALLAELQRYRDAYGGQLPNVELRNSCNVRDYRDVHELIEKAAEQESGLEEEWKQNQNSQNRGAKRPRDAQPAAEPAPLRPACERCGRFHAGECRMGACFACGERGHIARDCPKERQARRRRCYCCGQEGHQAWECPTLQGGNAEGAQPQQQRGQAAGARAYAVEGREGAEPIAGSVAVGGVTAFTLFDTGATHSFVSPRLTREWDFKGNFNTMPQERQQAKPCPSRTPPPPPPQAAAAPTPAKPAASRRNRAPSRRLLDSISRSDCFPNLDPDLLLQKLRAVTRWLGEEERGGSGGDVEKRVVTR
ncbi:hypothetical protein IGI04_030666 [Brassica rapa subsp. trilocularis]|uniref:CCHC-type domain-containing protein n=1 Tax=Brassica rapa subsp. trilocularis TaxID=1813537 RepID=A0ABQ7LU70_BRACM|nr:hypothetical protein IGI04_030666 [Brassica rapa subsp. trilocularis]